MTLLWFYTSPKQHMGHRLQISLTSIARTEKENRYKEKIRADPGDEIACLDRVHTGAVPFRAEQGAMTGLTSTQARHVNCILTVKPPSMHPKQPTANPRKNLICCTECQTAQFRCQHHTMQQNAHVCVRHNKNPNDTSSTLRRLGGWTENKFARRLLRYH
jgi:hypothetical protein